MEKDNTKKRAPFLHNQRLLTDLTLPYPSFLTERDKVTLQPAVLLQNIPNLQCLFLISPWLLISLDAHLSCPGLCHSENIPVPLILYKHF